MKITLTAENGQLYLREKLLLAFYPAGDCDTIPWPFRRLEDKSNLYSALYDAVNTGELPDGAEVYLPDGAAFGTAVGIHFVIPLVESEGGEE